VFQKPDGTATRVREGSDTEKDSDDRPICDIYASRDAVFVH